MCTSYHSSPANSEKKCFPGWIKGWQESGTDGKYDVIHVCQKLCLGQVKNKVFSIKGTADITW